MLADVKAAPDDNAPRLILADWLEDQGQADRAEFIRIQVALTHPFAPYNRQVDLERLEGLILEEHPWCAKLEEEVLRTERFNALAGRAVFAWIDREVDDTKGNVSRLQKDLDVNRYPVVAVLDVTVGGKDPPSTAKTPEPAKPGIQWDESVFAAWQQAVRDKKPLVVYFYHKWCKDNDSDGRCKWCAMLERETLRSERFNSLAGRAVFAWIDGEKDDAKGNVSRLLKDLNLDRLPVVVVLDVTADKIAERGRVIGYFPLDES